MKTTSALKLLSTVWENGMKDTWQRINYAMRNALSLAINSGLDFKASDFEHFANKFRWGYWVSESIEWIYLNAVVNRNESCIAAFEEYTGRKPFRANDVQFGYVSECYLHTSSPARQRERLAVGASFPYDGARWYVTKFDDEKGILRAARYVDRNQSGKPKQLKAFTHEEIEELFPSKEKFKKQSKALLDELQKKFSEIGDRDKATKFLQRKYGKKVHKLKQLLTEADWKALMATKFPGDKSAEE